MIAALRPGPVSAQTPAADGGVENATDAAAPENLEAPVLLESRAASYPAAADPGQPAPDVVLRLTLETDGHVAEVEFSQSGGPAFDDAARAAALAFRFSPARRDGVPTRARVTVRVPFVRPEVLAPAPVSAAPDSAKPSKTPAATSGIRAQEVFVGGTRETARLAESADAVTVLDLQRARREASSMADVLTRLPGVSIRREGGLGSTERLALNGLSDEHVATFVDSIPSDFSYSAAGIGSFPVSLSDRIEVYKGVVPVRFGTDALGGAINIQTDRQYENSLSASIVAGSFGTQRLSVAGAYRHEPSGFVANVTGFYDHARNNYKIDVDVADSEGGTTRERVPRFHDRYRAYGATAEVGVVDKPWARRLILQTYASTSAKEIQNNLIMTLPYGEVRSATTALGATLRYELELVPEVKLQVIAAYSHRTLDFVDRSEWVYNWWGQQRRPRQKPGETSNFEYYDQVTWRNSALGRAVLTYAITPAHVVTLTTAPTYAGQTGSTRIEYDPPRYDPLTGLNQRLTTVTGLEYAANFLPMPDSARPDSPGTGRNEIDGADEASYRLQNRLFLKHYLLQLWIDKTTPYGLRRNQTRDSSLFGVGDGFRFRFARWLMLKLSYEYAARLPSATEVFGDGILTMSNLELLPELSHNLNISPILELKQTAIGDLRIELTGFLRETRNQILVLGNANFFKYENVYSGRSLGVDAALNWTSPHRYVMLDGALSHQELRNTSQWGEFATNKGDRLPNKPSDFASWGARLHFEPRHRQQLEPFYTARYVGPFFRGWESKGDSQFKQRVPAQLGHGIGLTYVLIARAVDYSATIEIQNLTDAKLYDYFGAVRPGRSLWLTLTGGFH